MYLVDKRGPFNAENLKCYKSLEAYEYFLSRKDGCVFSQEVQKDAGLFVLRAEVIELDIYKKRTKCLETELEKIGVPFKFYEVQCNGLPFKKQWTRLDGFTKIEFNYKATKTVTLTPSGQVNVSVCYNHYGHEMSLEHVRIPTPQHEVIAAKLQQGVFKGTYIG
ncbi:hypothetical protein ACROYT_G014935 [Oculina patagonica]